MSVSFNKNKLLVMKSNLANKHRVLVAKIKDIRDITNE